MHILFFTFIAILLFAIYILTAREEKKFKSKYEPKGKLEEYSSDGRERRRYKRFDTELDVKYRLLKSLNSHSSTNGKNISKGGIAILTYEIFPKETILEIEISMPDSNSPINIKGKVAWCEEKGQLDSDGKRSFLAGIEFIDIKDEQQAKLSDYINTHLSKSE